MTKIELSRRKFLFDAGAATLGGAITATKISEWMAAVGGLAGFIEHETAPKILPVIGLDFAPADRNIAGLELLEVPDDNEAVIRRIVGNVYKDPLDLFDQYGLWAFHKDALILKLLERGESKLALVKACANYYGTHGDEHGFKNVWLMQQVWRQLGVSSTLHMIPLQNLFTSDIFEFIEDDYGNPGLMVNTPSDVVIERIKTALLKFPDTRVINCPIQFGKQGFHIIGGTASYHEAYSTGSFSKEQYLKNVNLALNIARAFPDQLVVLAAGDYAGGLFLARSEIRDWPANAVFTASPNQPYFTNITGADYYVSLDKPFDKAGWGSSNTTPFLAGVLDYLVSSGMTNREALLYLAHQSSNDNPTSGALQIKSERYFGSSNLEKIKAECKQKIVQRTC